MDGSTASSLRICLREPIPEIEAAAHHLSGAALAHRNGDTGAARELLHLANDSTIRLWLDEIWGRSSEYNRPRRRGHMVPLPKTMRCRQRHPGSAIKCIVHDRDGYYCRFCKIPVIRGIVRTYFSTRYPDVVPWGNTDRTQHAAFQCMWAQYDHLVPHAFGGTNEPNNIYLTCAGCNYGRGSFLIEEFDLLHPDDHPPRIGSWNGLEHVLAIGSGDRQQTRGTVAAPSVG